MKRLILIIAVFSLPAWAGCTNADPGAIKCVQHKQVDLGTVSTGQSCTFTANVTAGNALIVPVVYNNGSGQTLTVSSAGDGSFTAAIGPIVSPDRSQTATYIFYKANSVGGAGASTITVTPSASTGNLGFDCMEFSGLATASLLDQVNSGKNVATVASQPLTTGNVTTTQASEVLIGTGSTSFAGNTLSTGGSGTWTQSGFLNNNSSFFTQYQVVSSTGTYNSAVSTGGVASFWSATIATFKGAGGAAAKTCTLTVLGAGPC